MSKFFLLITVFFITLFVVLISIWGITFLYRKALKKELRLARGKRVLGRGKRGAKILLGWTAGLLALFFFASLWVLKSPVLGLVGMVFGFPFLYRWLLKKDHDQHLESIDQNSLSFLYALQGLSEVGINLPSALFLLAERIDGPFAAELKKSLKKYEDGKNLSELLEIFQKRAGLKLSGVYLNLIEMVYSQGLSVTPLLTKMVPLLEMESSANQKIKNLRKSSFAQIGIAFCIPWVVGMSLIYFQGDLVTKFLSSPTGWLILFLSLVIEIIGSRVIWQVSKFY